MAPHLTPAERFFAKVEFTDTCWLWTAAQRDGYGVFTIQRPKQCNAHRWAYEFCIGQIPAGLTIDHLCRVRHCVNPDHLEAVTNRENILRGVSIVADCARRESCPRGHPYNEINTYWYRKHRHCRPCQRQWQRMNPRKSKRPVDLDRSLAGAR